MARTGVPLRRREVDAVVRADEAEQRDGAARCWKPEVMDLAEWREEGAHRPAAQVAREPGVVVVAFAAVAIAEVDRDVWLAAGHHLGGHDLAAVLTISPASSTCTS